MSVRISVRSVLGACLLFVAGASAEPAARVEPAPSAIDGIRRLQAETGNRLTVEWNRATGTARLLRFAPGAPALALGVPRTAAPATIADAFLARHGAALGVDRSGLQLDRDETTRDAQGFAHVRYRQVHRGVPVFGGMLRVHVRPDGRLHAVNGITLPELVVDPTPRIGAARAGRLAAGHVAADLAVRIRLETAAPRLWVYRPGLIRGVAGPDHLVYEVEVRGPGIRELVYVDAHKGQVVDRIEGIHDALERRIYDRGFGEEFLVWTEGDAIPFGVEDIDNLIDYSSDTYNLFASLSGGTFLSWDGAGAPMEAVNDTPTFNCEASPNASWNGTTTSFCPGTTTDDVIAHEWAHAYTSRTHGLVYAWQSGALNEAYSDVWGEVVDQLNGTGGDSPAVPRSEGGCNPAFGVPLALTIVTPAELAGELVAIRARFDPPGPISVTAEVEEGFDGVDVATDACEPLDGFTAGRIALVDRGGCPFLVKTRHAQQAGAAAVIVVNDQGDWVQQMGGRDPAITIPSMMVGGADGQRIRAALVAGEVTASMVSRSVPEDDSLQWLVGEASAAFGGAIRDMWNPTCLGHPGKVSDARYWCSSSDSGGVHVNSGIPNHGFALLVEGGSFNGHAVDGIGLTKAAHIYWRAQTVYQTRLSQFAQHADLLELACEDLIGVPLPLPSTQSPDAVPSGEMISAGDCEELARMTQAIELRLPLPAQCAFEPALAKNPPGLCLQDPSDTLLYSDWEDGLGEWAVGRREVQDPETFDTPDWSVVSQLPGGREGFAVFVPDLVIGDCDTDLESGVLFLESPEVSVPVDLGGALWLSFDHWFATEPGWDGGNLKVSIDGGPFALVPEEAFIFNPYPGPLNEPSTNPLAPEPVFGGTDEGSLLGSWGRSIVDLGGLVAPGQGLRLRFEFGLDACNGVLGWYVDDVRIFSFAPVPEVCGDGIDNDCDPTTADLFDTDGDSFSCDLDCDDQDTTSWLAPGPVSRLTFPADTSNLAWEAASPPGGEPVTYELLRSTLRDDFAASLVCLPVTGTTGFDSHVPPLREVWYYLPRARNGCSQAGALGATGNGTPRQGGNCP